MTLTTSQNEYLEMWEVSAIEVKILPDSSLVSHIRSFANS